MMDVRKMASMGQKAMREQQSQSNARKVFWPLQAGRPRQMKPGLLEAVQAGRAAANRLYTAMAGEGLRIEDAGCVLVCARGDKVLKLGAFTAKNQDRCDLDMAYRILGNKLEPIGIAFMLIDREHSEILMHARPFEDTERAKRLLDAVLLEWELDFTKGATLKFA